MVGSLNEDQEPMPDGETEALVLAAGIVGPVGDVNDHAVRIARARCYGRRAPDGVDALHMRDALEYAGPAGRTGFQQQPRNRAGGRCGVR